MGLFDKFRSAWNAFTTNAAGANPNFEFGQQSSNATYGGQSPSRYRPNIYTERSIVSSIYTRISIDVAGVVIKHIHVDDVGRYSTDVQSALNDCLTKEPNLDQGPRSFRQDLAMTLFDRGCAAIVPVDTTRDPETNRIFDIQQLRVGEIVTWYPKHVRLSVYNQETGKREDITLEKRFVAIVENPLYSVMNEPNSTLQRLIRKLSLLDAVDEQSGSGKLDIIIQLPYVIKSEARKQQAEQRREDIEFQLRGSKYGIAYTDGTEKITQLNRPAENNLLKQVEYLTALLYSQLGLTEEVMNGTAAEDAMLNYYNRTIEPVLDAIVEALQRSFVAQNNERIRYYRDPFKLVPISQIADIADKFTRNEIATSNEIRGWLGIPPSTDPKADQLANSNMPQESRVMVRMDPNNQQANVNGASPKPAA